MAETQEIPTAQNSRFSELRRRALYLLSVAGFVSRQQKGGTGHCCRWRIKAEADPYNKKAMSMIQNLREKRHTIIAHNDRGL